MALTKVIGAGAEGLTLSSTSLTVANGLTLTDGDVALASGHGISFAATSDGGVSTPSELLDDYEEGTFTAVLTGASAAPSSAISVQSAYVKVGNQVFVRIYITNVNTSGASGNAQISGFPFTSSSLNILPCMTYGQDYDDSGGVMTVHMYIENGTTATLIATKDNAAWQTTGITAGSGKYWAVTGSYLTS